MPFNQDGICPDLLFSSHGMSSRMTIGMLREMVANQLATIDGRQFDASSFRLLPNERTTHAAAHGSCNHSFTCGKTGAYIGRGFMALAAYTIQRHLVKGKIHARAKGPRNAITGQAVEGRAHQGGLRMGNMEVNALASFGAISTLQEAMTAYDGREVCVCGCGRVVDLPGHRGATGCDKCSNKYRRIFVPRVTLVLHWELAAAGIDMRFITDKDSGEVKLVQPEQIDHLQ